MTHAKSKQSNCKCNCIADCKVATQLQELTCHIGSHVTCLPPGKGDIPAFTPARLVLDLATPEECKAELKQKEPYLVSAFIAVPSSHSSNLVSRVQSLQATIMKPAYWTLVHYK